MMRSIAAIQAQNYAAGVLNSAIGGALDSGITYDSMVETSRDSEGRITSIQTDALAQNRLRTDIASRTSAALSGVGYNKIVIPLGTITGLDMLVGRGPGIHLNVSMIGSTSVDFSSEFSSAGVNQTKHRIILSASVRVGVFYQSETIESGYSTSVVIAETIIVGEVPLAYAEITQK